MNEYRSEPWISTKELAQHLGVTMATIRKWILSESISCCRIGKLWKFKCSEVDEWIKSGGAKLIDKTTEDI